MKKILYDTNAQKLVTYQHPNGEPIIGLESYLLVLDLIEHDMPQNLGPCDIVRPTESIDLDALQVVRGWQVETAPKQWANAQTFMDAFTDTEKAMIALSADPTIAGMRLTLSTWLSPMHPDDARVQGGLDRLVTLGILTPERKAAIIETAS